MIIEGANEAPMWLHSPSDSREVGGVAAKKKVEEVTQKKQVDVDVSTPSKRRRRARKKRAAEENELQTKCAPV